MWEAKPGMKVVCIRESPKWIKRRAQGLKTPFLKGVYTIMSENICDEGSVCLEFREFGRQKFEEGTVYWHLVFEKSCFRPLVSNKGMEVLQEILKNPNKKISGFEQSKTKVKQGA